MLSPTTRTLPAHPERTSGADTVCVLGVEYTRFESPEGGELFLTRYGLSFREWLDPMNWFDPAWFKATRKRLLGTSTICRMPTKPVRDRTLDLVVRFSRVGEPVPVDTDTMCRNVDSDFNSPFEEMSLVMDLRTGRFGPPQRRIGTKRPLAIYAPPERLALWQTGRSEDRFARRAAAHPEMPLDIQRQYVLVYGWIQGQDAEQTADVEGLSGERRLAFLASLQRRVERELASKGFSVVDFKPAHIILRRKGPGRLVKRHDGEVAYALVDYELLQRTPEYRAWLDQHPAVLAAIGPQPDPRRALWSI